MLGRVGLNVGVGGNFRRLYATLVDLSRLEVVNRKLEKN